MAVNPIIECFSMEFVTEYCQGLESSAVYTTPPGFVESLHSPIRRNLPRLPLYMCPEVIIPTLLMWNIYIGICLPKALTVTRLQSYEMFKVLPIVRINKSVGLQGILNFGLLRDAFPYRLARWIPLKEGVPYALQSKVRTPPPHLRRTILGLQISHNA